VDGELRRTPVEDPDRLDLRRRSMGLAPVAVSAGLNLRDRPPRDSAARTRDFEAWLVRVGWREWSL
jgi:hypothetical protein